MSRKLAFLAFSLPEHPKGDLGVHGLVLMQPRIVSTGGDSTSEPRLGCMANLKLLHLPEHLIFDQGANGPGLVQYCITSNGGD